MPCLVDVPPITLQSAPLHIIVANCEGGFHHKLFQIRISSGAHPSLAVDFPYSPFESGIAMEAQWRPDDPDQRTYRWPDPSTSMTTSQRPKYNHHVDGRAHFSQDGKVRTVIKRQACPLREINGHAFTVHVQGIGRFPELADRDLVQNQRGARSIIGHSAGAQAPEMISIVGSVFERNVYFTHIAGRGLHVAREGDYTRYMYPDGRYETVAILTDSAEKLNRRDSLLVELRLSTHTIPDTNSDILLFIGGFDSLDFRRIKDLPGFLAMKFPATPDDRDLSLIESVDLPPRPKSRKLSP